MEPDSSSDQQLVGTGVDVPTNMQPKPSIATEKVTSSSSHVQEGGAAVTLGATGQSPKATSTARDMDSTTRVQGNTLSNATELLGNTFASGDAIASRGDEDKTEEKEKDRRNDKISTVSCDLDDLRVELKRSSTPSGPVVEKARKMGTVYAEMTTLYVENLEDRVFRLENSVRKLHRLGGSEKINGDNK